MFSLDKAENTLRFLAASSFPEEGIQPSVLSIINPGIVSANCTSRVVYQSATMYQLIDRLFSYFEGDSPMLQLIGKWGYKIYEERELIEMYIHLILSALFPIYIGAHASLRRPPSAADPVKSKTAVDEDDDEINVESTVEGLSPSDAILFPILAGFTLTGLYFLIKWIQDPKLLNKIMNYYFSFIGVFGVGKLAADFLNVATTFVFPSVWSSRGKTYVVDSILSQQLTEKFKPARTQIHRQFTDKTNPFPGILSSITFPSFVNKKLWALRTLLKNHWIFRAYVHGVANGKSKVQINDLVGHSWAYFLMSSQIIET